jgi:GT2 family glycosyltransferase
MCDLTITIVVVDRVDWAIECLRRIYEHTSGLSFEVIVVYNDLGANELPRLKNGFPEVKTVLFRGLSGFAQNQNAALRMARGRYIVLFNDDALLELNLFAKMVAFMDAHPTVGAVMPQLMNLDSSFQLGARGRATPWTASLYELKMHRLFPHSRRLAAYPMTYWDQNIPCEIETAAGACLMIRRVVVEQVGLLDERFAFGMEDIEWSHRIRENSWQLYYLGNLRLVHVRLATAQQDIASALTKLYQGAFLYYCQYFGWRRTSVYRLFLTIASFLQIIYWTVVYLLGGERRVRASSTIPGRWAVLKLCLDPKLKRSTLALVRQKPDVHLNPAAATGEKEVVGPMEQCEHATSR